MTQPCRPTVPSSFDELGQPGRFSRRQALVLPFAALVALRGSAQTLTQQSTPQSAVRSLVAGAELYSESAYLDAVSEDGRSGIIVRIGRFPEVRTAWLWGHVFLPSTGVLAWLDHEATDQPDRTPLDAPRVRYAGTGSGGGTLSIARSGDRLAPDGVLMRALMPMAPAPGKETNSVLIEARWSPVHRAFESLAGRSELLGTTEVSMSIGSSGYRVVGPGQFHEQVQQRPRFVAPFVYATLRGRGLSCIAIKTVEAARGFAVRGAGSAPIEVTAIEVTPPAPHRELRILLEDGGVLEGSVEATYRYTNRIFDDERQASVVRGTLGGEPISGCINDFLSERITYQRASHQTALGRDADQDP